MTDTNPILEARQEIAALRGTPCGQEEFASLAELSPSMVSRYERGTHLVSPRAMLRVQRLLARLRAKHQKA